MKYSLCPDAVLVTVLDESMLMLVGSEANRIENMRGINEDGVYLWRLLEKNTETDAVIENVMRDYEIDGDTARTAFTAFIEPLLEEGYITIVE